MVTGQSDDEKKTIEKWKNNVQKIEKFKNKNNKIKKYEKYEKLKK